MSKAAVSVFFYASPRQPLRNQGISRLLVHQLSGLAKAQGSVEVLVAKWNIDSLREIAQDQMVELEGVKFRTATPSASLTCILFFLKNFSTFPSARNKSKNLLRFNFLRKLKKSIWVIPIFGYGLSLILDSQAYTWVAFLIFIFFYFALNNPSYLIGLYARLKSHFMHRYRDALMNYEMKIVSIANSMSCTWLVPSPHQQLIRFFNNEVILIVPDVVGIEYPFLFGGNNDDNLQYQNNITEIRQTMGFAKAIICYSESVKIRQIVPLGLHSRDKIQVVHNASTIPQSKKKALDLSLPFPITHEYFFYPTQLRPYKNIETLIEALYIFNQIQRSNKDKEVHLLLTGSSDVATPLTMMIEEFGLTKHVDFTGIISGVELDFYYQSSIAAISPSWHEGGFSFFPISEAWAQDTPCLFSLTSANLEKLADAESSYTFMPGNAHELAEKMLNVYLNRNDVLSCQREELASIFSRTWNDVAIDYLKTVSKFH